MVMLVTEEGAGFSRQLLLGHTQVARVAGSARRCLFGPADPEETRALVRKELEHIYQQQKRRWNFDFEREVPLQGRYQWQPVANSSPQQSCTELRFSAAQVCKPLAEASGDAGSASEQQQHATTATSNATNETTSEVAKNHRQLHITDMLNVRKKRSLEATCPASKVACTSSCSATSSTTS